MEAKMQQLEVAKQAKGASVPSWWGKGEEKQTRTKFLQKRKDDNLPHPSFDLDGDGIVGGRDLVISKRFDEDGDGRLNTKERARAIEAINNGIEKDYVWNIEQAGSHRPFRIVQKRGVICDSDDFQNVAKTYPKHPLTQQKAHHATAQQLKEARVTKNRDSLETKKKAWDTTHPSTVTQKMIPSEYLVKNPKHNTVSQIRDEKKRLARAKAGLTEVNEDIKITKKDPKVGYVAAPTNQSKTLLENTRKTENLNELKNYEKMQGNHAIGMDRLNERESCIIRIGHKEVAKTKEQMEEQRKKSMLEYNMKVFGNVSIGIHGRELPKFTQPSPDKKTCNKQWWQKQNAYKENPKFTSVKMLKQSHKYWAKDDLMLLADAGTHQAPKDDFKQTYVKRVYKNQIADKPNEIKYIRDPNQDMPEGPVKRNYRWTSLEQQFAKTKGQRLFEGLPPAQPHQRDFDPLPSTFSPFGVFVPPPSSIEVLQKQKTVNNISQQTAATSKVKTTRGKTLGNAAEESLLGQGSGIPNLFSRVGTSPGEATAGKKEKMVETFNNFRTTVSTGVRSGAFKEL